MIQVLFIIIHLLFSGVNAHIRGYKQKRDFEASDLNSNYLPRRLYEDLGMNGNC